MFARSSSLELDSTVGRPFDENTGSLQDSDVQNAYQITKTISYNNLELDLIIDKPVGDTFDVLVVYHGTVWSDSQIHIPAQNTLNECYFENPHFLTFMLL